jgi:PAS domain S-box-containing protein
VRATAARTIDAQPKRFRRIAIAAAAGLSQRRGTAADHMMQHERGGDRDGMGQSSGVPAQGRADTPGLEPLGTSGRNHWRESTITEPGLDDRGNVFFAAIEMTRMPMILTDPGQDDNPIVFANKAFLDLTGYEEAEVQGRNCRFLQGAQTDRRTVAELRDAVAAKQSIAVEILNYRRDGSSFWNAVFIGPVYDVSGKLLYFFASQLDVSRRRNSEQAYRQAQKMESIGQLTAGLAHDFNNLLQVVNGNLELLSSRLQDDRQRRYLENARSASERGAKLTRQLLAFARKTRLEPRPTDLNLLIDGFRDVLETSTNHQVMLDIQLAPDLPQVTIDQQQLEMALLNIVLNARDASEPGARVTIALEQVHIGEGHGSELAAGDYAAIAIRDSGAGMPPQVIERATEPFFTTKGAGKGTGLGLAMAEGFLRQSRGGLEIESEPGRGTTVRMLFPALREEARTPEPNVETPTPAPIPSDGRAENILVVEDSAEVLELAREILESAGYRVATAMSGDDALRLFDARQEADGFDLVFTDLIMPGGMNGLALADAIGRRDPGVSILLTTGYNEELVAGNRRERAADVLSKPYRRAELLDRVRQALNRRGEGQRRREPSEFGAARE